MKKPADHKASPARRALRFTAAAMLTALCAASASADNAITCTISPERSVLAIGYPETVV